MLATAPRPTLQQRLALAPWNDGWPAMPSGDLGAPDCPPVSAWWKSWPDVFATARALEGDGEVPLAAAHAFLDSLERWTQAHRNHLTWPATSRGFASALVSSLGARDPDVLAVLAHNPVGCMAMLDDNPGMEASVAAHGAILLSVLGSFRRAPAPVAADAAGEAPTVRPEKTPRPPRPEHPAPSPELVEWLGGLAQEIRGSPSLPAVRRAHVDGALKQLRHAERADGQRGWFEDVLFPALASLPGPDVEVLLDHWPSHHRFEVRDPVAFVNTPRLWAILRDAPARDLLVHRGLVDWVDSSGWSFEQRHAMLEPMFKLVRSSERAFRERLALWQGWGGDLDQEVVVAPPSGDAFTATPDPVSARSWFLGQDHPMWRTVLEAPSQSRGRPRP